MLHDVLPRRDRMPAVTFPKRGTVDIGASCYSSTIAIARGMVLSPRMSPRCSRNCKFACTVEELMSPTTSQISRMDGGYPFVCTHCLMNAKICSCLAAVSCLTNDTVSMIYSSRIYPTQNTKQLALFSCMLLVDKE